MKRGIGKRILSLVLAVELFCSPLAVARAEDPARLREEIPLGEEVRPARDIADDLPVADPISVYDILGDTDIADADTDDSATDAAAADTDTTDTDTVDTDATDTDTKDTDDIDTDDRDGNVADDGALWDEETARPVPSVSGGGSIFDLPGMETAALSAVDLATIKRDSNKGLHHLGLSFGLPDSENDGIISYYDAYLRQESPMSEGYQTSWGYGGGTSGSNVNTKSISLANNGLNTDSYLYFFLPDMGRVPDLELEGLYLYNGAVDQNGGTYASWINNAKVLRSWSYDESHPENYKRLELEVVGQYGEADIETARTTLRLAKPTTIAGVTYSLVRFPARQVEEDLSFVYHLDADPDPYGAAEQWSIPIVARWVPSKDSDLAIFALDVTRSDTGETETVTDLYTKPFRQAGADDHLTAAGWSVSYFSQREEDLANDNYTNYIDVTHTATAFTPDPADEAEDHTQHYYLRVEEEQDSVTLRFLTREPNYKYHMIENGGGAIEPVTVTAVFTGKTDGTVYQSVDLAAQWDDDGQPILPQALRYGTSWIAQNNTQLPARGQWTAVNIPLQKVSQAADPDTDPFNTITITVTAPDGESQSVYVFHIERLMTPETTLGYGNTPAGMILRDTSARWASAQVQWGEAAAEVDPTADLAAYNKASAINFFGRNQTFQDMPITPNSAINQSGAIYKGHYSNLAWQGSSLDLEPTAVVAYQDMAFDDPGVSFVDSEGHRVVFGDGALSEYEGCVTRTLELRCVTGALTVDSYAAAGLRCWYNVRADGTPCLEFDQTKATQILRRADGGDPVDLRGLLVLPGTYQAVYTFTDPISGDILTAERAVVVLPIPGDVDMDGAVTAADAAALDANTADWDGNTTGVYPLLRHRVYGMDLGNNSGKLNAATIRQGFQPIRGDTEALGYSDYMYLPLPYTGSDGYHARRTWDQVTDLTGASGAKLRLDFLGIEQGTWNKVDGETYTNHISGPWDSPDTNGDNPGVSIVSGNPVSGTGDVFWMGVYVEDAGSMAGRPIKDLSISLVYDSEYVKPAVVHAAGAGLAYGDSATCWQVTTLLQYNLLAGSQGHTIFSGYNANHYTYANSTPDRPYATHYSKVEGELELAYTDVYGHLNASKLKEAVFSLQSRSADMATMKEGYLLVLPFQLIRHPEERIKNGNLAQLVELAAGMRDFSVVLDTGAAAHSQGIFTLFSAQPRTVAGTTYAFSAQDDIYGNTTQNIRQTVSYDYANDLVPIGKDNTQRIELEATYDTSVHFTDNAFYLHDIEGELPPGLTHAYSDSFISGTPTRVGVYDFTVEGQPYRITVKPKDIQYRAVEYSTYYGEREFRGSSTSADRSAGQRDFTFEYRRADLSDRDRAAAAAIYSGWTAEGWGTGDELETILMRAEERDTGVKYTAPVFYATPDRMDKTPVNYKTNVGKYDILTENQPTSTNYTLTSSISGSGGQLTIEARPVWIDHLTISQTRSNSGIYNDQAGTGLTLRVTEQEGEELIALTFDVSIQDGEGNCQIDGRPLTGSARVDGDLFGLSYAADYVQNDDDLAYVAAQGDQAIYRFLLNQNEEPRSLRVTAVDSRFIGVGYAISNYSLRGRVAPAQQSEPDDIVGTVVRRGVEAIEFVTYPGILQVNNDGTPKVQSYYGDKIIDPVALHVKVTRGAGDGVVYVGEYEYNNPSLRPMEIHYNWVSPSDMARGLLPENLETLVGTGWDPDLPEGQQDLRPYNGTDPLTPDMDGYYLCAAVKKYETALASDGEAHYIKVYSDHPVQVSKKTLTLTARPSTRYYGEPNGHLSYTYNYQDLIPEEINELRAWVRQQTGNPTAEPTGTGEEMEGFFRQYHPEGFVAPTLEVSKTYKTVTVSDDNKVDETTPVGGGEFYIILQGAASSYYNFVYARPREVNGTLTSQTENSTEYGFSRLTMLRRPIVISDVYSTDEEDPKTNFETIYADTKNLFLQNQTAGLDRLVFTLPENNDRTTAFYRYGTSGDRITLALTYSDPDGPAVVNGDDVTIRYSVRFMCDPGHAVWMGFDNNYYDVATISAEGGTMQKDVVVADMELRGNAAANYELVYKTAEQAAQRAPSNVARKTYPNPNHNGDNTIYLVHGTGAVTLRKITSMTLESVGQVNYTYGDGYAPYVNNAVSGTPMQLTLHYETDEDVRHNNGDYGRNVHSESLTFQMRQGVSNFAQRGLTIYYLKPGQTTQEAVALDQILDNAVPMIPDEHDGAQIFVTGKRREEDPTVTSRLSQDRLQVVKRALTFTVRDAHRFYGETLHVNDGDVLTDDYIGTTEFTYAFPTSQLAPRDRETLAQIKGVAVSALPEISTETDLKLLEENGVLALTEVSYTADPGVDAAVNKESWGEYPIGITTQDLAGYKVTGVPGTLYVYPRPVGVDNVRTSAEEPVYTIYNQSSSKQFIVQLDTEKVEMSRTNYSTTNIDGQVVEVDTHVSSRYCSDDVMRAMPLTGEALLPGDTLTFTVLLYFYDENGNTWNLDAGINDYAQPQVNITFREVRATGTAKNYAVSNVSLVPSATFSRDGFWGAVKLRTIDEIFITGMPKTQYTYGEALDLYGLQVTIRYKALQGMGEVNRVDYLGPDSFKQVGLYVNYWYPEDPVPGGRKPNSTELGEKDETTTTYVEDELRKALPNTYRRADTGDHVTIAPTHDTQQYIGSTSTNPLERPFAANGKYLIVSAFQEGDKQTAATPKILGAAVDNTSVGTAYERENAPIPIVVAPRQLRYDLAAADKTYDGTTRAAGTLTLTNLFDANTQVKVEESAGMISSTVERIRDVVYIPMGAAYEGQGDNASATGYDAYRNALRNGTISFTTGRYQPNGAAPLRENGTLVWSAGYEWGKGLTFTFANPNVHYLETGESEPRAIGTETLADYWRASQAANDVKDRWDRYGEICAMPVEVTGMVLAGPDAANYTWAVDGTAQAETVVSMTTRSAAEDGRASAPYATIRKANRATIQSLAGQGSTLPRLQMDEHTNVIRLLYDQDLTALADNNNANGTADEFRDELHFEYALYYESEDGLMTQWAGPQGDRAYQDTTFFGGELVRAETALDGAGADARAYRDTIFFGGEFDQPETTPVDARAYRDTIFFGGDFSRAGDDGAEGDGTGKGQRYRWAEEDTGLSALGYREDGGVVRDLTAGADYELYAWGSEGAGRAALPRDTVFYPMVRLSETHNYHASGNLTGDADVTAQMLDTAQKTRSRLTGAEGEEALLTDAIAASAVVFSAAQPMKAAAQELSALRVAYDAALAEQWATYEDVVSGAAQLPTESRPLMGSASAVKTFRQRLDLISTNREPVASWGEGEVQRPLAQNLEEVWFTDTVAYPQRADLDAVVYNSPLRYHYYYWDVDKSSRIDFADETYRVDLDTAIIAPIRQLQSDGSLEDLFYTYDPNTTNHTVRIYVHLAHIHAWGEWEITGPAACLEGGVESRTCAECGEVEHRDIPSLGGHAWGEWEVTVPAACLEEGVERHICAVCGAVEDRAIPSLGGHTWGQWTVTTPPTCTEDGVETRTCAVCGQTETQVAEKTGHHYGADGVCPDCGAHRPGSGGHGGGTVLRKFRIVPQLVFARLGDEPYMLNVSTGNVRPGDLHYTWLSSDPSVVTVSKYGVLTFRGEGVAIITVKSKDGWEATATVVVSAPLLASQTALLFNFYYSAAWGWLDDDYAFRPKEGMTRGELVTLLDVFLNPSDQWQATQELAYVDVTGREKYYDALRRLTGAGVVVGIPGETFAGDQLATRAEFVAMIGRMLQLDIVDTTGMAHTFADTDEVSTWAYAYIDALAKTGVIRGVGGGAFAPNRVITREETAAIIARLLTVKLDLTRDDLLRPSDMTPENWSYPAVLQAINTVIFPD